MLTGHMPQLQVMFYIMYCASTSCDMDGVVDLDFEEFTNEANISYKTASRFGLSFRELFLKLLVLFFLC